MASEVKGQAMLRPACYKCVVDLSSRPQMEATGVRAPWNHIRFAFLKSKAVKHMLEGDEIGKKSQHQFLHLLSNT